jgi:hypothetical protein
MVACKYSEPNIGQIYNGAKKYSEQSTLDKIKALVLWVKVFLKELFK